MMASEDSTLDRSSSSTRVTSVGKTSAREDTYSSADGDSFIAEDREDGGAEEEAPPPPPPRPSGLDELGLEPLDTTRTCGGAR